MHCFESVNADITGVGVRAAIYIGCLTMVIFGALSRIRPTPRARAGLFTNMRLQLYSWMAFTITVYTQMNRDHLSLFHEMVIVHLESMLIVSTFFSFFFSRSPRTRLIKIVTYFLVVIGVANCIWWVVEFYSPTCEPSSRENEPDGGLSHVTWVILFHVIIRGRKASLSFWYFTFFKAIGVILLGFWGHESVLAVYAIYFIEEVIEIERSFRLNPIDHSLEIILGYGQFLPLVMFVVANLLSWFDDRHSEAPPEPTLPFLPVRGGGIEAGANSSRPNTSQTEKLRISRTSVTLEPLAQV